ncbi:MAG TPA: hypothetical protein PLW10_20255, partial [Myxococcota bacterium]|nr:hypothetical protein [Myxococcota bacterium]
SRWCSDVRGFAIAIACAFLVSPCIAFSEEWSIIVHPGREERFDLSDVAQIYLKQRRYWKDGSAIVPVNRSADSAARDAFARAVLDAEPRSLVAYWNRQYFQGILPPITLASDEAVLRFVATEPRAMGYVPSSFVDDTVRTVVRFRWPPSL